MISYKKTCDDCMKEMFRRVGEEYPNLKLTNQARWFSLRTWTEKEEKDFTEWMRKLLKKRYRQIDKVTIDREVSMFILSYGWKVE